MFKVPIWNVKARPAFQVSTAGLHTGGRRHALERARTVQVNIAIMRVFVRLRDTLSLHKELAHKLAELERKIEGHDTNIRTLFDAIRELTTPPAKK